MRPKIIIIFPYRGYAKGSGHERLFWKVVERCREIAKDDRPVVVLNADTEHRKGAAAFLENRNSHRVEVHRVWSVDTCQMWLSGWGYVLDKYPKKDRIIQLPGDIDWVARSQDFFKHLDGFLKCGEQSNLAIGDFDAGGRFDAKTLIDYYGTYALMANWFPEITNKVLQLPLNRPRSEFLNIDVATLRKLLDYRKFAYEQTLNMLIRLWDFQTHDWQHGIQVRSHSLGKLADEGNSRQYRECLDQIERAERMLKMLWREIYLPETQRFDREDIWDRYHDLDQRSTSVRQTARIIIGNLLKVGS